MPKRTLQPKARKRAMTHGFRNRNPVILKARRAKGRKRLTVSSMAK